MTASIIVMLCGVFFFTGIIIQKIFCRKKPVPSIFIMFVIGCVWAISTMASVVDKEYVTPLPIHGLMSALVGYYFYRPPAKQPV